MVYEMQVDKQILRLDGRVFEVFSTDSDWSQRIHVAAIAFAAKGPDRSGGYKVQIGISDNGEVHVGANRTRLSLDAEQFARFERLVKLVRAARDAGPEDW